MPASELRDVSSAARSSARRVPPRREPNRSTAWQNVKVKTRCFGLPNSSPKHGSLLDDFPQLDPYGRVGQVPRAALLSGACPPRHVATARPHPAYPSVHMAPPQPASAHRPQPCAHGVGRVTWSGAGMREPHHSHPSRDGSQKGGPVPRPSLNLTPPSAGSSDFSTRAADPEGRPAVRVWRCDLLV